MTKIDIISGFLGAGKTTLIKKMLKEAFAGEQVVLIENEFGEIGIDGGFLKESGIEIREMNSGCICCSLVGDFGKSLKEVVETYHPDRILIEPSGVGKLSDVIKAVKGVQEDIDVELNSFTTVVDAMKCRLYKENFGEFYSNQVEHAGAIILSRTDKAKVEKVEESVQLLRELNAKAPIITTPISQLSGEKLLETMEGSKSLEEELLEETICPECGHPHGEHHEEYHEGHEHHEGCCGHGHHEGQEHEDHDHEHHHKHRKGCCGNGHHEADNHEGCCGHGHHEADNHEGCCGHHAAHNHEEHGHEHHHEHHHADEVFSSWGRETIKSYTSEEISNILRTLESDESCGGILRAKGMVASDGEWIYFDMVPEEHEVRTGAAEYTGRICVIGSELNEARLAELFGLN